METAPLELLEFVKNELLPLRLPTFVPKNKRWWYWRKTGLVAAFHGEISPADAIANFLKAKHKSPGLQKKLQKYVDQKIGSQFQAAEVYERLTTLFGRPFSPVSDAYKNWFDATRVIKEIILDDEYEALQNIGKDAVVIDAGANIGVFSVLAASLAEKGKIYAFEPARYL